MSYEPERLTDVSAAASGIRPEEIDEDSFLAIDPANAKEPTLVIAFDDEEGRLDFLAKAPDVRLEGKAVLPGQAPRGDAIFDPNWLSLFEDNHAPPWRPPGPVDQEEKGRGAEERRLWEALGLPDFSPPPERLYLRVRCSSARERDLLVERYGFHVAKNTRGTISAAWPPRPREDLSSLFFESKTLPRYPVYIPSKGRFSKDYAMTVKTLREDGVPFYVVVEPQERDEYVRLVGEESVLVLPFSNLGLGAVPSRNWIKEHSVSEGHARHWQLDDNIMEFRRLWHGRRIPCRAGVCLRVCEDLTDSFSNVAVSGLNYQMFVPAETPVPFYRNVHVYSCTLIKNDVVVRDGEPLRWRGRYNDDTDLCLQVLDADHATLLVNSFMANKLRTMVIGGGMTDEMYAGDGRLKMARSLEAVWPGTVSTRWRFGRPQHVVRWDRFETRLEPRDEPVIGTEYDLRLREVRPVKSPSLRRLLDETT